MQIKKNHNESAFDEAYKRIILSIYDIIYKFCIYLVQICTNCNGKSVSNMKCMNIMQASYFLLSTDSTLRDN